MLYHAINAVKLQYIDKVCLEINGLEIESDELAEQLPHILGGRPSRGFRQGRWHIRHPPNQTFGQATNHIMVCSQPANQLANESPEHGAHQCVSPCFRPSPTVQTQQILVLQCFRTQMLKNTITYLWCVFFEFARYSLPTWQAG